MAAPHTQQQQQQEPHPQLLEGLPLPALRLLVQHLNVPSRPATCHLSRISKALRAAAAALPVYIKVSYTQFDCIDWDDMDATSQALERYHQSLLAWLLRHAHCVEGLTLVCGDTSEAQPHEVLLTLAPSSAAAAAEPAAAGVAATAAAEEAHSDGVAAGHGTAAEAAPGDCAAAGSSMATPRCSLQRLHLENAGLTRAWANTLARFDRLQVLRLTGIGRCEPGMEQGLSLMKQLQKLALHWAGDYTSGEGEPLLRALPASLRALDLRLHSTYRCDSSSNSSSSVAHLVHLTSLRMAGIHLECQPGLDAQQQQQPPVAPGALQVLSMRPTSALSWFAAPSLETVELTGSLGATYMSPPVVNLAQLAACPRLRQLAVLYDSYMPEAFGVAALTQLTSLRLTTGAPQRDRSSSRLWYRRSSSDSSSSSSSSSDGSNVSSRYYGSQQGEPPSISIGCELAALRQLQVLEVGSCILAATDPGSWLPQLRHLTSLVVLVGMERRWCPEVLQHLAEVISGWHGSSSASSKAGAGSDGGPSGGSGEGGVQGPPCKLERVKLTLLVQQAGGWNSCGWAGLQEAAADMAAALPWLQVVCEEDSYSCPCWTVESEKQLCGMCLLP